MRVSEIDAIPTVLSVAIGGGLVELHEIADELEAAGWECGPLDPYGGAYAIHVARVQDTSDAAISAAIAEINRLIEDTEAVIDSWETALDVNQLDFQKPRCR